MVLAGPYGWVGRSWTTYLKKYFLASYLKVFIRTHCALQVRKGRSIYYVRTEGGGGLKEVANFANDSTDRLREM